MNTAASVSVPRATDRDLAGMEARLEALDAEARVAWALEYFGPRIVLASSFGAQAAVCLHLVTRQRPDIPVILVDTGYLFPETYEFVDDLRQRLALNLRVYRSKYGREWQEARLGRLWEEGREGISAYNRINKVEPMERALRELGADAWISGLRRSQSRSRERLPVLSRQRGRWKVHPIVEWSERTVYRYLKAHDLPYHPLWHKGYVSIGDTHTTRPLEPGMLEEETRFFGLSRECGLHEQG
jgi:phosphoadenosine phosphosulfate reductase